MTDAHGTEGVRPPPPSGVRIDTLGLAFPIDGFDEVGTTVSVTGWGTPGAAWSHRRALEGGGFLSTGKGGMAWVEASLPKRGGGDNIDGLDLAGAERAAAELLAEARQFVEPARPGRLVTRTPTGSVDVSVDNPKVVRLDLVRDFQLHHPPGLPLLLDGLAGVPQAGRCKVARFSDAERNAAQTLSVGPKAWKVTLYDKAAETRGAAPDGRLRFEARLHQDQLRSEFAIAHAGAVGYLADFAEAKLSRLRRAWFDRVGFGREVVSMDALWDRVGATDLTPRDRCAFVGWVMAHRVGRAHFAVVSRPTARKYRRLAGSLGVALDPDPHHAGQTTLALDFDAGAEVVRVA